MKKFLVFLSLIVFMGLLGCSTESISSYEEKLEEKGWDVYLIESEDFDEENAPDGIVKVLEAEKGLWDYGYIYEFNSSSNASSFFNEIKDEFLAEGGSDTDVDDYIKLSGNLVFYSFTKGFFEDLDMD